MGGSKVRPAESGTFSLDVMEAESAFEAVTEAMRTVADVLAAWRELVFNILIET